jgi:hypothetical protein
MLMKSNFIYQKNPAPHKTVERGASLAQRKLTKSQRAAMAADVFDGRTVYQPTRRELSGIFGVSSGYIDRARQLSLEKRQVVVEGRAGLARFNPPAHRPAMPKLGNGTSIDDKMLFDVIAAAGVDRVLGIAANVDQARH